MNSNLVVTSNLLPPTNIQYCNGRIWHMSTGIDPQTNRKIPIPPQRDVKFMDTRETDEQITLSSSEFDQFKDDNSPNTVTSELSQAIAIKEQLKLFRIFDKKLINVNEKTAKDTVSYFFKLSMLDPKPRRRRIIKFTPLLMGIAFLALAWYVFTLKQSGLPILASPYTYTAIVAFVAIGLILMVYVIKEFKNVLVFYSLNGRAAIIELLYKVPNKLEFRRFVSELVDAINTERTKNYYSESQILAAELSEHRKLRDEGGLTNSEYETAKNNIMKQH